MLNRSAYSGSQHKSDSGTTHVGRKSSVQISLALSVSKAELLLNFKCGGY